jgi:predicted nucleic-acid-binding protein
MTRIDTNYIIRYLTDDHVEMAAIAEKVFLNEDVFVGNEVLAEATYVLESVYRMDRKQIGVILIELIKPGNIALENKSVAIRALELYTQKRLDFVDCLLCAHGTTDAILSFDKQLLKCLKSDG